MDEPEHIYKPTVTPAPLRLVETLNDPAPREPTLMSMVVWGVIFPACALLVLAFALWWAHSGARS